MLSSSGPSAMHREKVSGLPHHVVNILVFLLWIITSFCCHKCAEMYLRLSHNTPHSVLVLTFSQISMCFCGLRLRRKRGVYFSNPDSTRTSVGWGHVIATLSTNYSLSLIPAASTFAIKLLEPITSVAFVYMTQSKRPKISMIISIVVIIFGAFIFTGNPLQDGVLLKGVLVALLSNIALAARNTSLKRAFKNNQEVASQTLLNTVVILMLTPSVTYTLVAFQGQENLFQGTLLVSASSLAHTFYSYLSVSLVLKSVSVVTHAVLNIFKRVAVVLLLCVFGQRSLSKFNIFGLLIAVTGLELYSGSWTSKSKDVITKVPITGASRHNRHKGSFCLFVGVICLIVVQIHISGLEFLPILEKEAMTRLSAVPRETSPLHFLNVTRKNYILHHTGYMSRIKNKQRVYFQSQGVEIGPRAKTVLDESQIGESGLQNPHSFGGAFAPNKLIANMSTFEDVIAESQRLEIDILGQLLKRFKYVVLMDIAVHENKGDAAITAGELLLLKRLGKEVIFYCNTYACSRQNMVAGRSKALTYGTQNVVVLCHGGGNLVGYVEHDTLRAWVFEIFHEFERIVLPQSIWLKLGNHLRETQGVYSKHSNVTLLLRDAVSFENARRHFPSNKRFLVPDSAFQIGQVSRYLQPSYDILWLRRADVESTHYKLPAFPPNISVTVEDWRKWLTARGPTNIENAFLIAHNGFTFLQRGRVVITDRLHGHIMCVLMHIPHVLLDTADHKVSRYHSTWTQGLEGDKVLTAVSAEDAMRKALELLEKFKDSLQTVDSVMSLRETII